MLSRASISQPTTRSTPVKGSACRLRRRQCARPNCVSQLNKNSEDRPAISSKELMSSFGNKREEQFVIPADVVDPESYVEYMKEYRALQSLLLDRTRQVGAGLALYLLFVVNGKAALCELMGCAASYGYLLWLFRDVDNLKPGDRIPMAEAMQMEGLENVAKLGAAYQHALNPRLLVPIGLSVLVAGFSYRVSPLSLLYEGCVMLGFLSYKFALIFKVVDDLSAKVESPIAQKPRLMQVEDELDMYGREKPKIASPTAALPQDVQDKLANEEGVKPTL